jgi:uncharacterized protein (DUF488 family)
MDEPAGQSHPFGQSDLVIWTIGHSTRTFDEFVRLLLEQQIGLLADVRHYPASQRVPWTTKAALATALRERGIAYEHFEGLGGYRKPHPDSGNQGWRNAGFRGYADHMASETFGTALERLLRIAAEVRTAIMCAEALPWKCHRSLLSDAIVARGVRVVHILGPGQSQDHRMTPFARIHAARVTYPATRKDV